PPMLPERSAWRCGVQALRPRTITAGHSARKMRAPSITPTCCIWFEGDAMTAAAIRIKESTLAPQHAVLDHTLPSGEPYLLEITKGQTLRIVDLEGNQAVDVIFYNRDDPAEHYSATQTLLRQGGIYLTTDSVLYSCDANAMLTIVADTCGRHDTLGGACAAESNTVRYALQKKFMHNCRDNYLIALQHADIGIGKRDLVPNINR